MIEVRGMRQSWRSRSGEVVAVDGVDLDVAPGEMLALTGSSGAGKTTLLLAIGGMRRPGAGSVSIDGQDVYGGAFDRRRIGFVFQTLELLPYLSALDNVLLARGGGASGPDRELRAGTLLEDLGLAERRHHRPGQLSAGERQRTALARALLPAPRVLLADEPTGNLDEDNGRTVFGALRRFAEGGGAVIVATHSREHAGDADRVLRLEHGRITAADGDEARA